jgi:hypothetical protein
MPAVYIGDLAGGWDESRVGEGVRGDDPVETSAEVVCLVSMWSMASSGRNVTH